MKAVILAGGKGTRISEESVLRPKPMIEIGGKPILWHIMKHYEKYGITEFVICCGYKGNLIKKYFVDYIRCQSDMVTDLSDKGISRTLLAKEKWKITLVDTGLETLTAGRILKIRKYVGEDRFFLTYGDGVADINMHDLLEFHKQQSTIATISVTKPQGRFGGVDLEKTNLVYGFREKARKDQAWVNIGYMVMEPQIFEYLGNGKSMLEGEPFEKLVRERQMSAYRHEGFWSPMDTIHDRNYLEELYCNHKAVWCE